MTYPNDWNVAPEEEIDYGEDEDLDVVEDDDLFFSHKERVQQVDLLEDDKISMKNNKVAGGDLFPKVSQPVIGKQDKKIEDGDEENDQVLLNEILTKGSKYFEEHKVMDARIKKTEVEIHVKPTPNDEGGGEEAMDISDDSGLFEELDENGAEILNIEKDLRDIEERENIFLPRGRDPELNIAAEDSVGEVIVPTLKAESKSLPGLQSEKLEPKDGGIIACDLKSDDGPSPFEQINFYPNEYQLQAELSGHANASYRLERGIFADEEISPKNKEKFDMHHDKTTNFMFSREEQPLLKSAKSTSDNPTQLPNGLPSPPLTEVGFDTRRNAIGASSGVSSPLNPDSQDQRKPKLNPQAQEWDHSVKGNNPSRSPRQATGDSKHLQALPKEDKVWPPWIEAKTAGSLGTTGIKNLSAGNIPETGGMDGSISVNMFNSSSFVQRNETMAHLRGHGQPKASAMPSGKHDFGYENSNDDPKEPNKERDKNIREYITSHEFPTHKAAFIFTKDSADRTGRGIALVRPARDKTILLEQPFTLERLLEHVRILYPVHPLTPEGRYDHLSFRLIRVNVSDPSNPTGFDNIGSMSDAYEDGGVLSQCYENEIRLNLGSIKDDEQVWVIRTFTQLWVQDGRDTSNFFKLDLVFPLSQENPTEPPKYFFAQYDITPDPPGCIKAQFNIGVRALMGREAIDEANVQVDRYKKEWLDWTSRMDDASFIRNFLWRIDDPTINVYPKNWKPYQSFEEAEEEREAQREGREQEAALAREILHSGSGIPADFHFMGQPNEIERRHSAERKELERREERLERGEIRLEMREGQMDVREQRLMAQERQVEQLLKELRRHREMFETTRGQMNDHNAAVMTRAQILQNAGRCRLPMGSGRVCGREVLEDVGADLVGPMITHWRDVHLPRSARCRLHEKCHTVLETLSEQEQQDHRAMHQQVGLVIKPVKSLSDAVGSNIGTRILGTGVPDARNPAPKYIGAIRTGHDNAGQQPQQDDASRNVGYLGVRGTTDGPTGLDANGLDPRSGLDPHLTGTRWICACGKDLTQFKKHNERRAKHYDTCHHSDAELVFRSFQEHKRMKAEEGATKAVAGDPKNSKKRKKDQNPGDGDQPDDPAEGSKSSKKRNTKSARVLAAQKQSE